MASRPPVVQDMPPAGGYSALNWKKTVRPKGSSGVFWFGAYIGYTVIMYSWWKYFHKFYKRTEFETTECRIAAEPFLLAEGDRNMLKAMWINREEERELMKDVPNWIVGTWYGEKVFNDMSRMTYPTRAEMYAHCDPKELHKRTWEKYWHS